MRNNVGTCVVEERGCGRRGCEGHCQVWKGASLGCNLCRHYHPLLTRESQAVDVDAEQRKHAKYFHLEAIH